VLAHRFGVPAADNVHKQTKSTCLGTSPIQFVRKCSNLLRDPVAKAMYVGGCWDAREAPDVADYRVLVEIPNCRMDATVSRRIPGPMPSERVVAREYGWAHELPNGTAGCTRLLLDSQ